MRSFAPQALLRFAADIFVALGSPREEAELIAGELIQANRMRLDTHGVVRIPSYADYVRHGEIEPGAPIRIVEETATTAVVDCGWNFGQVSAHRTLDVALDKARIGGLASVVTRNCHHVGRLGAYPERAARLGFICLAAATTRPRGHFVLPWGGTQGRLGTNPLAFGVPTEGDPILADFATSVIPEGAVRLALDRGSELPEDAVLDADGRPTRDPARFYGPPIGGLLPLGGAVGYKGYALGLMAEILAGALSGSAATDATRSVNGIWLLVIDPSAFLAGDAFRRLTTDYVAYLKSSTPVVASSPVLVPGEREFAALKDTEVISVDEGSWIRIVATASELGVTAPVSGALPT